MSVLKRTFLLGAFCSILEWKNVNSETVHTEPTITQLPRIYSLHIQSDIKFRFATTLVTSRVANPSEVAKEVEFEVTLPNEAFISNFTLEIEGEVYPGEVKEKEKAKKDYEKAKQRGQSAGHVAARPRETNRFKVQVNVASLSKVTFNLTYQELLKRQRGMYEHAIYIDPGQIVDDLRVDVVIQESREITAIDVPPLRNDLLTDVDITTPNEVAIISRPNPRSAYVQYYPSVEQQQARSEQGISGQFVIKYEIERELDAGDVLVVNGYFVHFFAPRGMDPIPKDALFILDLSTSMMGEKLHQLKVAMKRILDDLHEGDRFNMMEFSTHSSLWRDAGMVHATRRNIAAAKTRVEKMKASGWTNINEAVTNGVDYLNNLEDTTGRSPIVIFLTDGEASTGETNNDVILNNVDAENRFDVPIFSLAFGSGADYPFVKKIAVRNDGVGRKIYEDSDAALQISGFYDEISTVMLKNVTFQYLDDKVDNASLTKSSFNTYFDGSEMVVAGRLEDLDSSVLNLAVAANGVGGVVELNLASEVDEVPADEITTLTQSEDYAKITEKIWAYLTIKQLLDSLVTRTDPTEQQQIKQHVLEMSLKYNFVTPLTSMIVTKPEANDLLEDEDEDEATQRPPTRSGGGGTGRIRGGGGGYDPHFLIRVDGIEHPVCFDVRSQPGEVYRMLKDDVAHIEINAEIVAGTKYNKDNGRQQTYIGKIVVLTDTFWLEISPHKIIVNGNAFLWNTTQPIFVTGADISIAGKFQMLQVQIDNNVKTIINRHISKDLNRVDFLNFYVDKEEHLSEQSGGILGELAKKKVTLVRIQPEKGKVRGYFKVQESNNKLYHFRANLRERSDIIAHQVEMCWSVHINTIGLLGHDASDYLVKDRFVL